MAPAQAAQCPPVPGVLLRADHAHVPVVVPPVPDQRIPGKDPQVNEKFFIVMAWQDGWTDFLNVSSAAPAERLGQLTRTRFNYPDNAFRLVRRTDEFISEADLRRAWGHTGRERSE